jgi:hypothetical protein
MKQKPGAETEGRDRGQKPGAKTKGKANRQRLRDL